MSMGSGLDAVEGPTLDEWINSHTLRAVSGKSFVPTTQLREWLNRKSQAVAAQTVLETLVEDAVVSYGTEGKPSLSNVANSALVFCILSELGRGGLINDFLNNGISDDLIPIGMEHLRSLSEALGISESSLAVDFFNLQWKFCPTVFELDGNFACQSETVIPICSQTLIAKGRTARVYEVSIPEDFIGTNLRLASLASRYEQPQEPCRWSYRFALKTFDLAYVTLGKREMAAFQILKAHDNILRPVAAFQDVVDRDGGSLLASSEARATYCILLGYCELDLSEYFMSVDPPVIGREIEQFWRKLCGIIDAVAHIHRGYHIPSSEGKELLDFIGYHHDIKPSNILWSGDKFKLSDFGFAAFRSRSEQSLPASAASGTMTYGPPNPNLYSENPTLEGLQKFDIWSIGCVLSEAATWVVLGKTGLEKFQRLRREYLDTAHKESQLPRVPDSLATKAEPCRGDYFHDGRDVLPFVTSWHQLLREVARKSDFITARILNIVDQTVLVGQINRRGDANSLSRDLGEVFQQSQAEGHHSTSLDASLERLLGNEKVEYQ